MKTKKKRNPNEVKIPFMWQALEHTLFSSLSPLVCYIENTLIVLTFVLFLNLNFKENDSKLYKGKKIKGSPGTDILTIGEKKHLFFLFFFLRNQLKTLKLSGFLNMWGFKRTEYKGVKAEY